MPDTAAEVQARFVSGCEVTVGASEAVKEPVAEVMTDVVVDGANGAAAGAVMGTEVR